MHKETTIKAHVRINLYTLDTARTRKQEWTFYGLHLVTSTHANYRYKGIPYMYIFPNLSETLITYLDTF